MTGPTWDAIAHLCVLLTSTLLAASVFLTFRALKRVEHMRKISAQTLAFLSQSTSTKGDALTMTRHTCEYDGLADYLPLREAVDLFSDTPVGPYMQFVHPRCNCHFPLADFICVLASARALPLLLGHIRSTHELVEVLENKGLDMRN